MTLKQIDTRLALFPEYLRYRTDHWGELPFGVMHILHTTAMLFFKSTPPMTFDQWLYVNKHEDLIYFTVTSEWLYSTMPNIPIPLLPPSLFIKIN